MQGSGSGQGRVRRAATKKPVVEAFEDSKEEYDSHDDAHYVNPADTEIEAEDDLVDGDDEDDEEMASPEQAIPGGQDLRRVPLSEWSKPEIWAERQNHPDATATGLVVDPRFTNEFQQRVYHELLMTKGK